MNQKRQREEDSRSGSLESSKSFKKQKVDDSHHLLLKTTAVESSQKSVCAFCSKEITRSIKIICAECPDTEYCIDCLVSGRGEEGAESPHLHDYHIADKLNFNVVNSDWTAQEELNLLSNIEKYGLDNWVDISESLGNKSKFQCEAHYYKFYCRNSKDTLPTEKLCKNLEENSQIEEAETKIRIQNAGKIPEFTTCKDSKNRSRSVVKNRNRKDQATISSAAEILGYWPKREEFDVEFSNDAELEIAELEFLDDDTTEERQLKMDILKVYNAQLDEREYRKNFVIERGFLDLKRQMNFERKLSKDDRDIYNSIKPFARFFNDNSTFHEFFEGLVLEKNLKQRINQLKQYKKISSIKTYEDIEKHLELESRNKKDDSKKSANIFESCGLGTRVSRYLQLNNEHGAELDSNEIEKKFLKRLDVPKSTYYDMKKRINKELLAEKDSKNIVQRILPKYNNICEETALGIVDFVISLNNSNM